MTNYWTGRCLPTSRAWPVPSLGAVGFWLYPAHGDNVAVLLGTAALGLTAVFGIGWVVRARARRRLNAALDAYAMREIDRERRRTALLSHRKVSLTAGCPTQQ
jgi:hypothetical protein